MRLALLFISAIALLAQEGHPLSGTWHGSYGPNPQQQTDATFILKWDGKEVSGILNPGFDSIRLKKATLDPKAWLIRFEAETKDGKPIVVEGKIEDVTSPTRQVVGTWTQGGVTAPFKMSRDN